MTNTTIPQAHCPKLSDHDTHEFVANGVWGPDKHTSRCPGRHTGHGFETTASIAHPMDTDPFAGTDSIWD